ncbi:hypothetical protein LX32DRAFT_640367 [Colletotrichum zoysiae]|uniref:Uncharacterized protein n=1 Tax=Colletotrichum zoysiae TaxID=1216348 RepID=A0AAD9HFL3_9PEZI|nr:hypothetical protein LX32DRAFT_640367 [Colletotrichum zoysiae]
MRGLAQALLLAPALVGAAPSKMAVEKATSTIRAPPNLCPSFPPLFFPAGTGNVRDGLTYPSTSRLALDLRHL